MINNRKNRHEKFALFKGMTLREAAIEAGYKPSRAPQTATRMVRNGKILNRILELQKAAQGS